MYPFFLNQEGVKRLHEIREEVKEGLIETTIKFSPFLLNETFGFDGLEKLVDLGTDSQVGQRSAIVLELVEIPGALVEVVGDVLLLDEIRLR